MTDVDTIRESPLFDAEWYVSRYPDVALLGMDPAEHYFRIGGALLRDPGPNFSTAAYLRQNRDVAARGVNALRHYEKFGRSADRKLAPRHGTKDIRDATPAVPLFDGAPPRERAARVVSFYLPQFHPIAENDEWWGEGFTEWSNVRPAQPLLPGHYQPHIPGELGYYDLRDTAVQRRQVELAKLYGVEAFCFYFYWFAGKRLLETPVRNYLEDDSLDLPFMLCWANENWSRRWDGRDNDVLIAQDHSPDDDLAFIEHIADYLRDPRYERIDGRPILLVYRPNLLPDPAATAARWRQWCREHDVGEIYLAYTQSFESTDPQVYGFDAAIEFPPNNSGIRDANAVTPRFGSFKGKIFHWDDLVDRSFSYSGTPYRRYRSVCPSWDNTARRGEAATLIAGSSPGRFTRWITNAVRDTRRRSRSEQDRLVFVNAWNEWAEGAHLEPDQRYGYAWLESVRVGLACAAEPSPVDASSPVEVVHDLSVAQMLLKVPEWEARGVRLVVRADASDQLDVDEDDLRTRFAADSELGLAVLGDATYGYGDLQPYVERIAKRLGLDESEAARFTWQAAGSFAVRVSCLVPLASLAFDAAARDPAEPGFVPALDDVLAAALPLSVTATGARVSGLVDTPADGPMSVVIVSHDAHPHGAQRLALSLAESYRALGFTVDMIVLGPGPLLSRFEEVATVHRIDLAHDSPGRILGTLTALRDKGTTFAIANTTVSGALTLWLRETGFTVVSLVHEMTSVLSEMGLTQAADQLTENADVVVFPSRVVQRQFEAFVGRPVDGAVVRPQGIYLTAEPTDGVMPAGGSVRQRHGLPADARIVLGVGYGDFRKGIDLFVEAGIEILRGDPQAVAIWVGHLQQGELISVAERRLADAGLRDRFIFAGLVDDPEVYYEAAEVFLLTSREDPFPSVVLEAMDAELPVIAFRDATGTQELLERGAGVLVESFDAGAMAHEALALMAAPHVAAKLGAVGQVIVRQEFSFRDYVFDLAGFGGVSLPKVSVIVPNFNYGHLLYARLESILSQTMPVYEIIVLDDASTDNSVEILTEFAKHSPVPIQVVLNETNSGSVFRQWRKGVELATGDLIWVAEADDLSDRNFLRHVARAFDDDAVVMSYCQSKMLDVNGNVTQSNYLDYVADIDPAKWLTSYRHDGVDEIRTAMYLKNTVPNVSTAVFRRQVWLETLREHEDEILAHSNAGDWVAYLRLLEKGEIAFVPESLNLHRRHAQSVTISNFNMHQLRQIAAVQRETIQRFGLGHDATARAASYVHQLYVQFGLATDEHPTFESHPESESPLRAR